MSEELLDVSSPELAVIVEVSSVSIVATSTSELATSVSELDISVEESLVTVATEATSVETLAVSPENDPVSPPILLSKSSGSRPLPFGSSSSLLGSFPFSLSPP